MAMEAVQARKTGEPCLEECVDAYRARDVMSTKLVTVKVGATVRDAAAAMSGRNVGSVLVLDEEGRLAGILTERDLVHLVARGVDPSTRVEEVMTRKLITAKPDEPLISVFCKMIKNNIRHVPVVDEEGRPLGIVSMRDIVNAEAAGVVCS